MSGEARREALFAAPPVRPGKKWPQVACCAILGPSAGANLRVLVGTFTA